MNQTVGQRVVTHAFDTPLIYQLAAMDGFVRRTCLWQCPGWPLR
jgi:hypothetical protein